MRLIGTIATGETPTADETADGLLVLNDMLENWSTETLSVWGSSNQTFNTVPSACTAVDWQARSNEWKYGTDALPPALGSSAARMRSAYRTAEISYLVGRDDDSTAATFSVLDKSCPAELQGDYRLQRGLGYAEYDRSVLAGATHAVTIVHHCAHDVCCVLTAPEARPALFPRSP